VCQKKKACCFHYEIRRIIKRPFPTDVEIEVKMVIGHTDCRVEQQDFSERSRNVWKRRYVTLYVQKLCGTNGEWFHPRQVPGTLFGVGIATRDGCSERKAG
jgi:hypothetical protein